MSQAVIGDLALDRGIADHLFVANKVWATDRWLSDNSQAEEQFQLSAERLWRAQMDVMQVHSLTNAEQMLHLLHQWKEQGRIRLLGITDWNSEAYDTIERLVRMADLNFIQIDYSIFSRRIEARLLPACADYGVAVLTNIPLEKARLFAVVGDRPLPGWAAEIGAKSWAQAFLKFVLAHPAVTCVIPATSNPDHMAENMEALRGPLPDDQIKRQMIAFMEDIPEFAGTRRMPPYPGKNYGGVATWPYG